MTSQINIHLPNGVLQRLQSVKDFVGGSVNSLSNSAQQAGESLKTTATTTTDRAIDTVTTSLEQTWQTAEQFKNTTSGAVKDAIASSVSDWLTQHPIFFRLVQILGWGANHPIISVVILLFALALLWSIIRAIVRLIETASWSILQVPLKLLQVLFQVSFLSLTKVGSFAVQRIAGAKKADNLPALLPESFQPNKQQRLAEISSRLAAIQKEQHELLQEAADLIAADTIDMEVSKIKQLKSAESHLG
ncbi:Mechanosensitive ion channel protein MscS [Nostoc sp. DSM 114160]|jgi:acetolactate synthase regulatory subunit